jgi:hypothetical protein
MEMVKIFLGDGLIALIDDADHLIVGRLRWRPHPTDATTYARHRGTRNGKTVDVLMHRLILGVPAGVKVQHLNGNGLDNRRRNIQAIQSKPQTQKPNRRKK